MPWTLGLSHEKIYVHGYREYISALEGNYSDRARIRKLEYAFDIFYQKKIEANGYEAGIVVSSSWRTKGDVAFLRELFAQHSCSKHIIDKTMNERWKDSSKPDPFSNIRGNRALEINHWLDTNSSKLNVKDYVVLDDVDSDLKKTHGNKFIHCDQKNDLFSEEGLNLAVNSLGLGIRMASHDDCTNNSSMNIIYS